LSTWCLLRGLSTILHLGPTSGMQDRGKEFMAQAGPAAKTKTQSAADTAASATGGAAKTRESATTTGRPAVGKM